jgi:hypothetical protein
LCIYQYNSLYPTHILFDCKMSSNSWHIYLQIYSSFVYHYIFL